MITQDLGIWEKEKKTKLKSQKLLRTMDRKFGGQVRKGKRTSELECWRIHYHVFSYLFNK